MEGILIYTAIQDDEWQQNGANWISCILSKGLESCPKPPFDNIGAFYIISVLPSTFGIILFVFFIQWDDCLIWWELIHGNFDAIYERRAKANTWVFSTSTGAGSSTHNRAGTNGSRYMRLPIPSLFKSSKHHGGNALAALNKYESGVGIHVNENELVTTGARNLNNVVSNLIPPADVPAIPPPPPVEEDQSHALTNSSPIEVDVSE